MKNKLNYRDIFKLTIVSVMALAIILSSCTTPTPTVTEPGVATSVPPTSVPATAVPATAVPPTAVPPTAPPAEPKVLKIRLYGDIQVLDPAFYVSANDKVVGTNIYSGLVTYGANSYDIVNDLAESIATSDDGTVITFKLKEGVQWQNGYGEVTTEDVKFSYERFIDPELKASYADDWAQLDHVEIIDKYNGKIILKGPFAPIWHSTLPVTAGWVLCKKYAEAVGLEGLATKPVGSGPYILSEWLPKQQVTLTRNPDYFGTQPYYDEIDFIPIEDDKAAEIAMEAGELDFSQVSIDSYERFSSDSTFTTVKVPNIRFSWIGLNVENPKLADINVRLAIRYGVDVQSILDAAYFGLVDRELGLIAPGLVGYWPDAPRYERDVEKAKEYLAKAGLTSLDIRFDILNTTEYQTWAQVVQQNLKDVGINITINPMDSASFWSLGDGDKGKDAEMFGINYSMEPDPSWATVWFTTPQIGIWNWMRWSSTEYDQLHQEGLTTLDNAKRTEIYIRMQQLFDEAAHTIWISHGNLVFVNKPSINVAMTPNGVIQPRFFSGTP
ncbi:MAG: ABC transporter substrate-binding protein [Anaerolineales bacterium]